MNRISCKACLEFNQPFGIKSFRLDEREDGLIEAKCTVCDSTVFVFKKIWQLNEGKQAYLSIKSDTKRKD